MNSAVDNYPYLRRLSRAILNILFTIAISQFGKTCHAGATAGRNYAGASGALKSLSNVQGWWFLRSYKS